jgi:hypothetical protein
MKHLLRDPQAVLTLWQPHAAMMLPYGLEPPKKRHETRGWPAPAKLMGKPVCIHSALRIPGNLAPELEQEVAEVYGAQWRRGATYGAVLGVGILAECYPALPERALSPSDLVLGSWGPLRWAWRFEDVVPLILPVACAGSQRVWYLDSETRGFVQEL